MTRPTPAAAPFFWPVRIYWEDTDAGGVVYHANYLRFMERARTEWLRAQGVDQRELAQRTGAVFVVTRTDLQYRRPAHLDDVLDVAVEPLRIGPASMTFGQSIQRGTTVLTQASVRVGHVDATTWRPRPLPDIEPFASLQRTLRAAADATLPEPNA